MVEHKFKLKKAALAALFMFGFIPFVFTSCEIFNKKVLLKFQIPYAVNSSTFKRVSTVIDKFNRENKKTKIELIPAQSRRELYNHITLGIEAKNKDLPNLVIHYPSLAYYAASQNKALDFSSALTLSSLSSDFLKQYNRFNSDKITNLPLAISSEALVINKPLLGYFLLELEKYATKNGISLNLERVPIFKLAKDYFTNLKTLTKVEDLELWKLKFNFNKTLILDNKNLFEDLDLNSYENLFRFTSVIHASTEKGNVDYLYSQSVVNTTYSIMFNDANQDYNHYFLKYNSSQTLDIRNILENPDRQNELKKIYFLYKTMFEDKELNIAFGNENTSEINSKFFSLVSNRIYDTIKRRLPNLDDFLFLNAPIKNANSKENGSYFLQGLNLIGIKKSTKENQALLDFVKWMYNKDNFSKYTINNKQYFLTPVEYLNLSLGYYYPSDNFDSIIENSQENVTLKNIKNLFDSQNVKFLEPVDFESERFRRGLLLSIQTLKRGIDLGNPIDFETFINTIKRGI
ncbi:extracellular solute-binding protein [Mycoplasma struthionis]|uniref:Extracellular solute-binding protein n=2 Tax=Mycoplasma struthionis TaxID=538220 RepID=A0A3G8LJX9_9MOLU|nr:extracellular solute-binding protein [Mycoplasma struthionis]AZG68948.1 extracellular solute-binding protein [Mycoplasma struthionis]